MQKTTTGMSLQYVFHMTSLLCDNYMTACFKIINHSFASFIVDASDFSSDVLFLQRLWYDSVGYRTRERSTTEPPLPDCGTLLLN